MVLAPFNSYLGPSLSGARDCGRRLALRRNLLSADLDKEDDSSAWQEGIIISFKPLQPKSAISFGGSMGCVWRSNSSSGDVDRQ